MQIFGDCAWKNSFKMRLQLNAVIFITLSLGKLPFISSSKNPTQTQNITLGKSFTNFVNDVVKKHVTLFSSTYKYRF